MRMWRELSRLNNNINNKSQLIIHFYFFENVFFILGGWDFFIKIWQIFLNVSHASYKDLTLISFLVVFIQSILNMRTSHYYGRRVWVLLFYGLNYGRIILIIDISKVFIKSSWLRWGILMNSQLAFSSQLKLIFKRVRFIINHENFFFRFSRCLRMDGGIASLWWYLLLFPVNVIKILLRGIIANLSYCSLILCRLCR